MIIYLNGTFTDDRSASVSIWDAGFLFGEGVFTTLRLYKGIPIDLAGHWLRLKNQSATLDIPFPMSLEEISGIVATLVQKNDLAGSDSRLRLTLTRGGNPDQPIPVVPLPDSPPTFLATLTPLSSSLDEEILRGIPVITLGPKFLRRHLPEVKSLNYLPSLLALREARKCGCAEAIILGEDDRLTEGAASNLFLVSDEVLTTPAADGCILPGQTRQRVLDLASKANISCREQTLTKKDLASADEVFLCNSIREIVPVIRIDNSPVGKGNPGPVTLQILALFRQAMRR
jgi:D-amino acid aminotransferase